MTILLEVESATSPAATVTEYQAEHPAELSVTPPIADAVEPERKPKSIWAYLRVSLSAAVLLLLVALGAAVILVPWVTQSVPMTVLTSSMEPTLPPGTLVVISPVAVEDIRIGDVVTYQLRSGDPAVVTHRVIGFTLNADGERTFTFQGDNNAEPDQDQVRAVQIQGRLWYSVPYVGWVNTWINGDARAWVVPLVAGALLSYAAWMVISGILDRKKGGSARSAGRSTGDSAARPSGRHAA